MNFTIFMKINIIHMVSLQIPMDILIIAIIRTIRILHNIIFKTMINSQILKGVLKLLKLHLNFL